ncbi:CotD family spore coat protein, partial [Bacillus sp. JJ1122]|uniref:CotD family spore coat protein n=1 Tax=Bacillus sp. JJ1122 TaxID=3122951 RepID=UPI002FFE6C69
MYCKPTNVLPTVVHPTKCCVNHNYVNNVVPHIHPTHTTNVNHINYDHVHYFPQTQSTVNQVTNQNFYGGSGPGVGPMGPRPRPGFGGAPGMGMGPG